MVFKAQDYPFSKILGADNRLITCSLDCLIRIWDAHVSRLIFAFPTCLKTGEVLQTLRGHKNTINDMLLVDNTLVTCSKDQTVRFWDLTVTVEELCITN